MKINQYLKIILFIVLVFTVFPKKIWSQETIKLPPFQSVRTSLIDIKHIAIDLQFDWKKKQAFGTTSIELSLLKSTNKLNLDAGMLTINSIKLKDGTHVEFNYDGSDKNDALEITLNKNYQQNEELSIIIDYHTNWINEIDPNSLGGNNGKGLRFTEPTSNDPIKKNEIWSFGDPESNRYWFPSYDNPNDLRTTEFITTIDKKFTVISNGTLIETKNNTDGTITFHYKMDVPYPNNQTAFVIGEFTNTKQKYQDITINNFGYDNEKEWVKATVERLPDMMQFFSEITGVTYPYSSYSQVFVQDIGTFNGNTSFSTITENMVDDYETHTDFLYLWDITQAESLAQQWFGNYITSKDYSDIWLNKSFAHYFNYLYNEQKIGHDELLLWQFTYDQGLYFNDWNSGIKHPIVTKNYDDVATFTSDNYATSRGTLVLHMLRKELGEKNWKKAIKHYVQSNGNKLVTTNDFQKAIEEVTGKSIAWFFDQWIYKMGHPIFEITKNYDASKKQLTLTITQSQKIDPKNELSQTNFFQGKIAIEIDDKIEQIVLQPIEKNIFIFSLSKQPKLVNFDFESTWIKEITFEKTYDEILYEFENSKDILARNSALFELVNLYKNNKINSHEKIKIKKAFQKAIVSKSYWRFRNSVITQLHLLFEQNRLDESTITVLLQIIKNEESWIKANAIRVLGTTNDAKYIDLYLKNLNDKSFRVINSAAVALGKTKSSLAFDALAKLVNKPSMKSQSLLCALSGLKELGDSRGFDIAFDSLSNLKLPRWRLATSNWDYRVFAASLIASLGKSEKAYSMIFERFKKSIQENDVDGIFNNIVLINALAYSKGQEAYDLLKEKYKNDASIMKAVNQFEELFKNAVKK